MNWIAPHVTGGLGNRLFQLGAAAGLAEKWGRPLVFFLPRCAPTDHGPFENLFLLFPDIPIQETAEEWETLQEKSHELYRFVPFPDTCPISPEKPIVLHGWRQSEKYFPKEGLKLNFVHALGTEKAASIQKRIPPGSWFVHVRIGDYKFLPHHQVDLSSYYAHCLQQIPQGAKLFLFSDEPELCQNFFKQSAETLGLSFEVFSSSDELESMYAMSLCKGGAITANSTFSWWGAYCAKQGADTSFKAFYPTVWGQGMPPPVDLIPLWGERVDVSET